MQRDWADGQRCCITSDPTHDVENSLEKCVKRVSATVYIKSKEIFLHSGIYESWYKIGWFGFHCFLCFFLVLKIKNAGLNVQKLLCVPLEPSVNREAAPNCRCTYACWTVDKRRITCWYVLNTARLGLFTSKYPVKAMNKNTTITAKVTP